MVGDDFERSWTSTLDEIESAASNVVFETDRVVASEKVFVVPSICGDLFDILAVDIDVRDDVAPGVEFLVSAEVVPVREDISSSVDTAEAKTGPV